MMIMGIITMKTDIRKMIQKKLITLQLIHSLHTITLLAQTIPILSD